METTKHQIQNKANKKKRRQTNKQQTETNKQQQKQGHTQTMGKQNKTLYIKENIKQIKNGKQEKQKNTI